MTCPKSHALETIWDMIQKGERGRRKNHISSDPWVRKEYLSSHVNQKAVYTCLSGSIKRHISSYQRQTWNKTYFILINPKPTPIELEKQQNTCIHCPDALFFFFYIFSLALLKPFPTLRQNTVKKKAILPPGSLIQTRSNP